MLKRPVGNESDHADGPSDAALMLQVKRGDMAAFSQLVDRWQVPVMRFIYRTVSDETEAEDLAQAAFVQVWKNAGRYEASAKFSTYLFTIARNLALNEVRRRSRHRTISLDDDEGDEEGKSRFERVVDAGQLAAPDQLQKAELVAKVQEALDDLPEKQRTALMLCRETDLSYDEIAKVIDASVPATKSLIHRAREVLKARLKPYLKLGVWNP